MSSEMVPGKCLASGAVRHYFKASATVAKMLAIMFEAVFPEEYEKYSKAFRAGVWYTEDPGPWIARAIVYKLHVNLHHDGKTLDQPPPSLSGTGRAVTWSCLSWRQG